MRNSTGQKNNPINGGSRLAYHGICLSPVTCDLFSASELTPDKHVACADNRVDRSVTCAPHEACCIRHHCLSVLSLGLASGLLNTLSQ